MWVDIFLFDGFTALDAVGPFEALSRLPEVKVTFSALAPGAIRTGNGFLALQAERSIYDADSPNVLLFPGGDVSSIQTISQNPDFLKAVRRHHQHTAFTASVCTGALFLGAADLLRGERVATHWRAKSLLLQYGAEYSAERVSRNGKLISSAGVSAGIELGITLAGIIAGDSVGAAIELSMEYSPSPPYGGVAAAQASPELIDLVKSRLR